MVIKRMCASPYRDWVIAAFQKNLRFDRFTEMQLASDFIKSSPDEHPEDLLSPVPITVCCRRLMRVDCRSKNTEQSIRLTESEIFLECGWEQLLVVLSAMTINTIRIRAEISMPLVRSLQISTTRRTWVSRAVVGTNTLPTARDPEQAVVGPFDRALLLSSIERSIGSVKASTIAREKAVGAGATRGEQPEAEKRREVGSKSRKEKRKPLRVQKRTQFQGTEPPEIVQARKHQST